MSPPKKKLEEKYGNACCSMMNLKKEMNSTDSNLFYSFSFCSLYAATAWVY